MVRKYCIVPMCASSSVKTPDKLFFSVPIKAELRKIWLKAIRRADPIAPSSCVHCCEDHFDLPRDMENYMQYHLMGSVSQVRTKPGCIPTKFDCQPERKSRTSNSIERRKMVIEECGIDESNLVTQYSSDHSSPNSTEAIDHLDSVNFEEYNSGVEEQACVCCLDSTTKLAKLSTCKHTGIIDILVDIKVEYEELYVCYICHNTLDKFHRFRKQVQDSLYVLQRKDETVPKKLNQYRISEPEVCYCSGYTNDILNNDSITGEFSTSMQVHSGSFYQQTTCRNGYQAVNANNYCEDDNFGSSSNIDYAGEVEIDIKGERSEIKLEGADVKKVYEVALVDEEDRDEGPEIYGVHPLQNDESFNMATEKAEENDVCIPESSNKSKSTSRSGLRYITLGEAEMLAEREGKRRRKRYSLAAHTCDTCILAFQHDQYLKEHVDRYHSQSLGTFVCKYCCCVFESSATLSVHLKKHMNRYECLECKKRYVQFTAAQIHYNSVHATQKKYHKCGKCEYQTTSLKEIRRHRASHNTKIVCSECKTTFTHQSGLKRHMLLSHSSKPMHECSKCDKKYKYHNTLILHMNTEHSDVIRETDYYCTECNIHFKSKYSLKSHMERTKAHLKDADLIYTCDDCGRTFVNKKQVESHISFIHLRMSKHSCQTCNKIFRSAGNLKDHVRYVHESCMKPRNYVCDHCGKGFKAARTLVAHVRSHTGERPLRCALCPATFAHPASHYNHNRLVHKIRPKQRQP